MERQVDHILELYPFRLGVALGHGLVGQPLLPELDEARLVGRGLWRLPCWTDEKFQVITLADLLPGGLAPLRRPRQYVWLEPRRRGSQRALPPLGLRGHQG
jgi:hypothetical protein